MRRYLFVFTCAALPQLTFAQVADTVFPCPLHRLNNLPIVDLQLVDINLDGHVDLLSLGMYPSGLDTAVGLAQGGFAPTVQRTVPWRPRAVAVADFDRDGDLDAVVAQHEDNVSGGYYSILGDIGNSAVPPAITHAVGLKPNSVAAGDIDGDTTVDLLFGDDTPLSSNAWWVRGAGDGTFGMPQPLDMGRYARCVKLADVDADGRLDAVALTNTLFGMRITVWRGTGTPTDPLGPPQQSVAPSLSESLVLEDLDQDGLLDAAVIIRPTLPTPGRVAVLRGVGDGSFASATMHEIGIRPRRVVPGDFDGDGRGDLMTVNDGYFTGSSLSLLRSTGSGGLAPQREFFGFSNVLGLATALVNGDSRSDAVIAVSSNSLNYDRGHAVTLPAEPDGSIAPYPATEVGFLFGFDHSVAGDFDRDGSVDVAAIANVPFQGQEIVNLRGDATGHFQIAQHLTSALAAPIDLRMAELDGDGRDDLVVLFQGYDDPRRSVRVYHGRANGTFEVSLGLPGGNPTFGLAVGDLDGDGRTDVVNSLRQNYLILNRGSSGGGFEPPTRFGLPKIGEHVVLADFNGDGRDDVIVRTQDDYRFVLRLSTPGGGFAQPVPLSYLDWLNWVHPANIDGDGKLDLLVYGISWSPPAYVALAYLPGRGDGTFDPARIVGDGTGTYSIVGVADFDLDGDADIVTNAGWLQLYRGLGDGSFGAPERTMCPWHFVASGCIDADADGDLDLVGTGDGLSALVILRNRTRP